MVDVVGDLNARFNRVYIAKKGDTNEPRFVDQFYKDDNNRIVLRSYNTKREVHKDDIFNEDDYILDCPKVGMAFDGEKAFYISRTPDRQWKRGYNNNVIKMKTLSYKESREMNLAPREHISPEILNFVYNPKYIKMEDGLKSMADGKFFSFPIARKYAITLSDECKFPVVIYKEWKVGWVEEGVIQLTKSTNHLYEELSQYTACRRG